MVDPVDAYELSVVSATVKDPVTDTSFVVAVVVARKAVVLEVVRSDVEARLVIPWFRRDNH